MRPAASDVGAALVDQNGLSCLRSRSLQLFEAAIESAFQRDGHVVQSGPLVAEVAIRRPAALAVVLRADDHIHAAIEYDVNLFAERESADRGIADHWDQKPAFAAGLLHRMAQVGR